MRICPSCRQPIDGPCPMGALFDADLTRMERKLVAVLIAARAQVSKADLADRLYADDPDGGPDGAEQVIDKMLWKLRKTLPQYGWTIPRMPVNGRGNKGFYRLEPTETPTKGN